MKSLKKIFGLNSRLDRKGYLFLGVLPMIGFIFWVSISSSSQTNSIISLILFVSISILSLISAVKRGRDSGLNGLVTLFLFGAIPIIIFMVVNVQLKIDISYAIFLFIVYLLLIPSTPKDLKAMEKIEYVFTIISIGLVFLLLMATLIAPRTFCIEEKGKIDLVCVNMKGVSNALKMFKIDNGVYPETDEGFQALQMNPNADKYPNYAADAYLEKLPKDSWGNKMLYVKTKNGFEIISYGADRKEGGEDEDADIFYSECK